MNALHIDASAGVAGDMLLGALLDAGADTAHVRAQIRTIAPEAEMSLHQVSRNGIRATQVTFAAIDPSPHRDWASIRAQLTPGRLSEAVAARATAVFTRLAAAEGEVHGVAADAVHFHEVGSLDSIADVVGCCAAFESLGDPGPVTSGPVATGSGTVTGSHGVMPVPAPAVLRVFAGSGATIVPGPGTFETCTPTGAALLAELVDHWVVGPALAPTTIGVGAGSADPPSHANVTRVVLGKAPSDPGSESDTGFNAAVTSAAGPVVLETNIDDLDPRLWPRIQAVLLAAGASDAWLTPILMKKGRPAHTLSVLVTADRVDMLTGLVFRETSAIGLRMAPVSKRMAARAEHAVLVRGRSIRIKVAAWDGAVVNVQPEWEDVAAAANDLALPAKQVLAETVAAAHGLWSGQR